MRGLRIHGTGVVVCGGIRDPRHRRVQRKERTVSIGEILWWLLLAGVLVWGWDYIQQFKR